MEISTKHLKIYKKTCCSLKQHKNDIKIGKKNTKTQNENFQPFPCQSDKGSQFRLHSLIFIAFAEQWCIIPTWSFANQCNKLTVSENRGIPKSSILIGFSIVKHPFGGIPNFWKPPYMENIMKHLIMRFVALQSTDSKNWDVSKTEVGRSHHSAGK